MSAISLKSITGITSITTPTGVDNQLTLHNNNTTEAVKLDIAGNLHFHNHLNITGISTAANFKTGTSNLHNTGLNVFDLDVDGHTNLDNLSVAGVSTFAGAIDLNADLDVDGHTNLDNVSIAGIVTALNFVKTDGTTVGGAMTGYNNDPGENNVTTLIAGRGAGNNIQLQNSDGQSAFGNVLIGDGAGKFAQNGYDYNVAVGSYAHNKLRDGSYNISIGYRANPNVSTQVSSNTIAIGYETLDNFVGGGTAVTNGRNTVVGHAAAGTLVSGGNNLVLGMSADVSSANISNEITLGNTSINHLRVPGIGVSFSAGGAVIAGVCTATSFSGDGSALTGITQTTINNNANNRIITGSGTANTLEGESTFTFDGTGVDINAGAGSHLQVDGSGSYLQVAGIKIWMGLNSRSHNTAIGNGAGANFSGGQDTTAVGHNALALATSGSANTAIGSHAMCQTVTGSNNVAVGHGSLNKITSGYSNSVLGRYAGLEMLGGYNNTLMGLEAGYNITSGNSNTAYGFKSLRTISTNAACTAIGSNALQVATGGNNTALGFAAGQQVSTGTNNVLLGSSAGLSIQAGTNNVAIGNDALRLGSSNNVNYNVVIGTSLNQATNAYNNVVLGYTNAQYNGSNTWHGNVIAGYQCGNVGGSANQNVILGQNACYNAGDSINSDIIIGRSAGRQLGNSSSSNVIIGAEAAYNAGYGGSSNHGYAWTGGIAIGYKALYNGLSGPYHTIAIGTNCLYQHDGDGDRSSGGYIVAMGTGAAENCKHMRHTVIIGNAAGGNWNPVKGNQHEGGGTFIGGGAGRTCSTGASLIAIGRDALSNNGVCTGNYNTAIGSRCFERMTSGSNNCAVGGLYTGLMVTTGDYNNFFGSLAGYAYNVNTTGTGDHNNVFGGYSAASAAGNDHENIFGGGLTGKGANTTYLRGSVYNSPNTSSFSTTSDERIKKNIVDNNIGLDAIEKIRVRNFEYRTKNEITDFDNAGAVVVEKEGVQLGVIAQEIKEILPDVVKQNTTGAYAVDPDNLTWYLVNAVKELSAEVKSLKAQINS